jgi:hypothetical protein
MALVDKFKKLSAPSHETCYQTVDQRTNTDKHNLMGYKSRNISSQYLQTEPNVNESGDISSNDFEPFTD